MCCSSTCELLTAQPRAVAAVCGTTPTCFNQPSSIGVLYHGVWQVFQLEERERGEWLTAAAWE